MKTIKIITLLISAFVLSVVMVLPTGAFAAKSQLNKQINKQINSEATKAKSFSPRPWDWDNKKPKRQITSNKPQHPKPWVHNASTTNNLQQLNKMRAVMALHLRSNGSFCQVDMRGGAKKNTPSFVKSAHRSTDLPKSKFDICSAQERKAFQKQAKNSYLKGGKAQKTSVGAVAGMLAKSVGVGCIFGAGVAWVADMFSGGGDDASNAKTAKATKTEAGANCVDCANKKSKQEKEVEGLRTATIVAGTGGAVAGVIPGFNATYATLPKESIFSIIFSRNNTKQDLKFLRASGASIGAGLFVLAGSIAGAIVCENGTTYLLSDKPKTDI